MIAVGHRMPVWIRDGFDEYAKRMPREMPLALTEIKPEPRHGASDARAIEQLMQREAVRISKALPDRGSVVVLDERGKTCTSTELAKRIVRWRDDGDDVSFVIGGADGIAPTLKARADWLWSLSSLTLPHGLVRVLLVEQLYRAVSILGNHPYHRE